MKWLPLTKLEDEGKSVSILWHVWKRGGAILEMKTREELMDRDIKEHWLWVKCISLLRGVLVRRVKWRALFEHVQLNPAKSGFPIVFCIIFAFE